MKTKINKFRIGELADKLNLKHFIIRFWEKEFNFKPRRSKGGQRYYTNQDIKKFQLIKELLYEKNFTILGAKKYLENIINNKNKALLPASKINYNEKSKNIPKANDQFFEKITNLQEKLIRLRELL